MIKRYAQNGYYMIIEKSDGSWCKYEDVQKLEELVKYLMQNLFICDEFYLLNKAKEKLKQIQQPERSHSKDCASNSFGGGPCNCKQPDGGSNE